MPSTLTNNLKISHSPAERRRHPRYPFTGTLEAFEPESQTRIQGRTADLSEGGCYVDTLVAFPAQTRVKVRITRDKRSFESPAIVVYSVTGLGMGLRFESTDPQQLLTLRKWLDELGGEAIAEIPIEKEKNSPRDAAGYESVLNELVGELMRKGVLAENIGKGMLRQLASGA
jgi:hypothetical protein